MASLGSSSTVSKLRKSNSRVGKKQAQKKQAQSQKQKKQTKIKMSEDDMLWEDNPSSSERETAMSADLDVKRRSASSCSRRSRSPSFTPLDFQKTKKSSLPNVAPTSCSAASASTSISSNAASKQRPPSSSSSRSSFTTAISHSLQTPRSLPCHDIEKVGREIFNIASFRYSQKEIIAMSLQRNRDIFVIMRTGGGKSLTYQLPSYIEAR